MSGRIKERLQHMSDLYHKSHKGGINLYHCGDFECQQNVVALLNICGDSFSSDEELFNLLCEFVEVSEHVLLNNGNHIRAGGCGYGDLQDCINEARSFIKERN